MRNVFALLPLLAAAACYGDETISGYSDRATIWRLASLDGAAFEARATLQFPVEGRISGHAPCNGYSATQTAPYPWFDVGPAMVTRRACAQLDSEQAFLAALVDMSQAEVLGDTLILRNEAGREMVFHPEQP